tara:strand:+ start:263 stop:523 length:261 start_codon:yes stop_codon:yes gene_type:complete
MNLTHEETNLVITGLQNMRAELYINNNLPKMKMVSDVIKRIEDEMESKDLSQKKIMLDDIIEVGSETGIEERYNDLLPPRNCEVCD